MSGIKLLVAAVTGAALLGGVTGFTAYAAEQRKIGSGTLAVPASLQPGGPTGGATPAPTAGTAAGTAAGSTTGTEAGTGATPTGTPTPVVAAILNRGDRGEQVRELQFRLRKAGSYRGSITGFYGPVTERGVRRFQDARGLAATGAVDAATLRKLRAVTPRPTRADLHPAPPPEERAAPVDERCRVGRVICVSKSKRRLYWVVDGEVQLSMSVRFGSRFTPTREGRFSVYLKSRDHVSRLYGSRMPYAMFFSGGQAVHYSSDFAASGYGGASHGCVNTRSRTKTARLFSEVQVGDSVVVYRG